MFRPWLQVEWFRKITNYQRKLVFFQKFSDEVMDGVMPFSSFHSFTLTNTHTHQHPHIQFNQYKFIYQQRSLTFSVDLSQIHFSSNRMIFNSFTRSRAAHSFHFHFFTRSLFNENCQLCCSVERVLRITSVIGLS